MRIHTLSALNCFTLELIWLMGVHNDSLAKFVCSGFLMASQAGHWGDHGWFDGGSARNGSLSLEHWLGSSASDSEKRLGLHS